MRHPTRSVAAPVLDVPEAATTGLNTPGTGLPSCRPGTGVDPDDWFPTDEDQPDLHVLTVCAGCPARRWCLATALRRSELGIWAGTTTSDRERAQTAAHGGVIEQRAVDELLTLAASRATKAVERETVGQARPSVELIAS